jgi:prepilin-type N-terminal cleavage/methylation domain-containing protein
MKRNQSGFTLIEIAIVLVIIGLLLGGVLKGQELINSAKVKNLGTDFRNIPVYIYGYQDKFRALPGDDANPTVHLGTVAVSGVGGTLGNGVIEGNWNDPASSKSEAVVFWQHVRLANLATGATDLTDPSYIPTNNAGGIIGIQSGTSDPTKTPMKSTAGIAISGSYVICSSGILGKFVKQLDLQMDDGNTNGGSMMATDTTITPYAIGATATPTASVIDANSYTVCMGV